MTLGVFDVDSDFRNANITSYSESGRHDVSVNVTAGDVTASEVVLIVGLSVFIVAIFVGNVFVVLSVALFCKMRTLSNGLIASLASADLLVSVVVLPISLQHEVVGRWTLGPYVCDFWITSDVFCCTASILNIVVIALDRYWLITLNVKYTHSAVFSRRRVCLTMLAVAWTVSALISSSPLLGWRTGTEKQNPDVCMISQDYGYTVFSTFSSFWIPLFVILVVYLKIFLFARRRVIRKTRQYRSAAQTGNSGGATGSRSRGRSRFIVGRRPGLRPRAERRSDSLSPSESTLFPVRCRGCRGGLPEEGNLGGEAAIESSVSGLAAGEAGDRGPEPFSDDDEEEEENFGDVAFTGGGGDPASNNGGGGGASSSAGDTPGSNRRILASSAGSGYEIRATVTVSLARAQKTNARRIRRSARTLGLIIGGFLVCWLPFFLVATVGPFCGPDSVPPVVQSLVLWLGYSNSLLNPAIYAIWEKTFRKSFRRLSTCDVR